MNQRHQEIVTVFIQPCEDMFGPLPEQRIERYCIRLEDYDNSTLRRAVEYLEDYYLGRGFPQLAKCREACQRMQKHSGDGGSIATDSVSFATRKTRDQRNMFSDYVTRKLYGKSVNPLVKQARDEGWFNELRELVRNAAWMQSERICGIKNRSWLDKGVATAEGKIPEEEILQAYSEQAKAGVIEMRISGVWLRWAKDRAQKRNPTAVINRDLGHISQFL